MLAAVLGLVPAQETAPVPRAGDPAITAALAAIITERQVPAMAGAIVSSGGIRTLGVAGWKKIGDPTPVAIDDAWHLGSDTKAMTAALAARLVERGLLRWDSSVAQILPEAGPAWAGVTLDHLLAHRAGISGEPDFSNIPDRPAAIRAITARPPATQPGSAYRYSNAGYVLAGAMIERVAGRPWETLIRAEVWEPLHMAGCGFGGMGTPGLVDALWGHRADGTPAGNGPLADNPPVMAPAATAHMPIRAWASFIADQLRGARGDPALLAVESYRHLQAPWPGGEYARGWIVVQREWAKGTALTHTGSNTMNMAVAWLGPGVDRAILVCCN